MHYHCARFSSKIPLTAVSLKRISKTVSWDTAKDLLTAVITALHTAKKIRSSAGLSSPSNRGAWGITDVTPKQRVLVKYPWRYRHNYEVLYLMMLPQFLVLKQDLRSWDTSSFLPTPPRQASDCQQPAVHQGSSPQPQHYRSMPVIGGLCPMPAAGQVHVITHFFPQGISCFCYSQAECWLLPFAARRLLEIRKSSLVDIQRGAEQSSLLEQIQGWQQQRFHSTWCPQHQHPYSCRQQHPTNSPDHTQAVTAGQDISCESGGLGGMIFPSFKIMPSLYLQKIEETAFITYHHASACW